MSVSFPFLVLNFSLLCPSSFFPFPTLYFTSLVLESLEAFSLRFAIYVQSGPCLQLSTSPWMMLFPFLPSPKISSSWTQECCQFSMRRTWACWEVSKAHDEVFRSQPLLCTTLLCSAHVMYPEAPKSILGIYASRIGAMQGNGRDRKFVLNWTIIGKIIPSELW